MILLLLNLLNLVLEGKLGCNSHMKEVEHIDNRKIDQINKNCNIKSRKQRSVVTHSSYIESNWQRMMSEV